MAGWLKRENDGSSVKDSVDTPRGAQKPVIFSDLGIEKNADDETKWSFTDFLKAFLDEVYGVSRLRPLPPVIGEGQVVDLLKLKIVVRNRGGYCIVSENGLWSSVAADCGLDLRFSASLKLIYVKYLDTLERWLAKIENYRQQGVSGIEERYLNFSRFFMGLESDPKVFVSSKIERDDEFVEPKKREFGGVDENIGFVEVNVDVKGFDEKWSNGNGGGDNDHNVNISEKHSVDKVCDGDGDGDVRTDEDSVSRKRKRECYMGLLNWVRNVAKDPGGPGAEALPERQKWKCHRGELPWKQILGVREAMLLKKHVDAGPQQSVWQKKQKMHPGMYDDDSVSERLRYSQRLLSSKDPSRKSRDRTGAESSSSGVQTDEDNVDKQSDADSPIYLSNYRRKRIPISSNHQADLPEFQGKDYQSESKWLGTKIWPLDKSEQKKKTLIERDRIGKGRQESCGCHFAGSADCVRFHIREKRLKVKLELGSAFYLWKLDVMGEDVAFSWTKDDQNKFHHIVQSNRLSLEKYFWDELFKHFPNKGREALVSYYFNVFLLQRRAIQNRTSPTDINSDDEESDFGPIANRFGAGSIFRSPKKRQSGNR